MSTFSTPLKIKNPLLEFCLLNGYTTCLGYFTQNRFETVDTFLINSEQVQNFISIHPNILSTLFFAQLDWFKQTSTGDNTKVDHNQDVDDSNDDSNEQINLDLIQQPIVQLNPSVFNKETSIVFNRVSDGDFPFIKNKLFTISGFEFPQMPDDFLLFNVDMNDALLASYTTKKLNIMFRDVCRVIWKRIKPAYPNNVPEQCLHEICAVFVYKYPTAQLNFEKIRKLNPLVVRPELVDIGVRCLL